MYPSCPPRRSSSLPVCIERIVQRRQGRAAGGANPGQAQLQAAFTQAWELRALLGTGLGECCLAEFYDQSRAGQVVRAKHALDQVLEREFAQRGVRQAQYQLQVGAAVVAPLKQTRKAFAQQPGGQTMQQTDAIRQVPEFGPGQSYAARMHPRRQTAPT